MKKYLVNLFMNASFMSKLFLTIITKNSFQPHANQLFVECHFRALHFIWIWQCIRILS